jgi:hypothetical protein
VCRSLAGRPSLLVDWEIRLDDKAEAEAELARVQSYAANARLREVGGRRGEASVGQNLETAASAAAGWGTETLTDEQRAIVAQATAKHAADVDTALQERRRDLLDLYGSAEFEETAATGKVCRDLMWLQRLWETVNVLAEEKGRIPYLNAAGELRWWRQEHSSRIVRVAVPTPAATIC